MTITCEIVSQDRMVYSGEAEIVVLPGMAGQMGILPHHSPVLTALNYGIITVRNKSEELHFTVAGGVAEVLPEKITILADAAENVEEIDIERAVKAKERAEERLKLTLASDTDRYMRVTSALKRSNLRLQAAQKYRKNIKSRL
ncbi:MAG TPA: ATP synthase F1 subunit epsilon [Anaerolineaceae bacterium]|nr:ATP synthase F1 subunit epsilon [Anaerolineaceae bacterium]